MVEPFDDHRAAARALITSSDLRPREGQFLGGIMFDVNPLADKQANWLRILLDRHGLPPLTEGGDA